MSAPLRSRLSLVVNPLTPVNTLPGQNSLAGFAVDPVALRAVLAGNWSRFCMQAFPDDTAKGAAFFAVTEQCFRNWVAGDVCRPSGHHVALAVLRFGPMVADLLAEGAARAPLPRPHLVRVA